MRVNHFLTSTLAAATLLVASCSTQKLAQNNSADDVYNTTAQARVYKYSPPPQTAQIDTTRSNDPNYRASDPDYDMDYASRIDRFYYGSPNRVYFDDYYNFYGYNSWYNPYSFSLGFNYGWNNWYWGYNRWSNPYYSSWYYYGSPYYWNTWGPYSYYSPWYGGGYYGGGYWGGGWGGSVIVRNNENYRPRPNRGAENGIGSRPNGSIIDRSSRSGGNIGNTGRTGSRPESYNPTTNGTMSRGNSNNTRDSRPSRASSSNNGGDNGYRPTRTSESSRPTYTPPPSSSSNGSSSGRTGGSSSSGSSSSGGSSGGRPTRGGGR